MRLHARIRLLLKGAVTGSLLALLLYVAYVELGSAEREQAARERGCFICHRDVEHSLPLLKAQPIGEDPTPALARRIRQVHPLLSKGAEQELAHILHERALPALAQARAGKPGRELYLNKCAACHGKDGLGSPGNYPPLLGSEWLTAEPSRLPEILSQGLREPITVKGEAWEKTMLAPGIHDADQAAELIHYLRATFAR